MNITPNTSDGTTKVTINKTEWKALRKIGNLCKIISCNSGTIGLVGEDPPEPMSDAERRDSIGTIAAGAASNLFRLAAKMDPNAPKDEDEDEKLDDENPAFKDDDGGPSPVIGSPATTEQSVSARA